MSEPLGVEERARLRADAQSCVDWYSQDQTVWQRRYLVLDREVDRLTGELESREHKGSMWVSKAAFDRLAEALEADKTEYEEGALAYAAQQKLRAERAETDLADEKRRHAGLVAGVEANDHGHPDGQCRFCDNIRALLSDTATEETGKL